MRHGAFYASPSQKSAKPLSEAGDGWETMVVAFVPGWVSSFAVDNTGVPHFAYYDMRNYSLYYSVLSDNSWETQLVESNAGAQGIGCMSSKLSDSF